MVQPDGNPAEESAQGSEIAGTARTGAAAGGTAGATQESTSPSSSEKPASKPPAQRPQVKKGYSHLFKYVIVGDCGVGKTALLKRFTTDAFVDTHVYTIGVDFDIAVLPLPSGDEVKLQLWDTAGQERFRTITSSYYRGCHGIIVVYDITDSESFYSVERWVREVERYCNDDVIITVVGSKADLALDADDSLQAYGPDSMRKHLEDNNQLADDDKDSSQGALVYEVYQASSKTGEGVKEVFKAMTDKLVARRLNARNPLRGGGGVRKGDKALGHEPIRLGQQGTKPKKRCC